MDIRKPAPVLYGLLPHLFFLVLFIMAVLFYRERLMMDSSYYLFHVLNYKSFWIEHDRVVLALSQWLPLAGAWLGLGFKWLLLLYSIGHVLFFYLVYLIARYGFKDANAGLLLLIIQTTGILHGFFVPMFELYYGAGLLVLFNSILKYGSRKPYHFGALIVLEVIILLSHPMTFVLFVFTLALHYLDGYRKVVYPYIAFAIVLVCVFVFKHFHLSEYEQSKSADLFQYVGTWLTPGYYKTLALYLLQYYWEVLLFLLATVVYYILRKRLLHIALLLAFFFGMVFIIGSTYIGLETGRYMEQVYFPVVFISALPLVYGLVEGLSGKGKVVVVLLVFGLVGHRMAQIYNTGWHLSLGRNQMERTIQHCRDLGSSKCVIDPFNLARSYSFANWSYPVESLLISAIDGPQHTVSLPRVADFDKKRSQEQLADSRFIFRFDEVHDDSILNPDYFHLDQGPYLLLNPPEMLPESLGDFVQKISISAQPKAWYKKGSIAYLTVKVANTNSFPLRSHRANGLFLAYHWYKDGVLYYWDGIRTPLEVDVRDSHRQDMQVLMPKEKGLYTLQVDLVLENKMWLGINREYAIEIRP